MRIWKSLAMLAVVSILSLGAVPANDQSAARAPDAPAAAPRLDAWKIIGPGGGGTHYFPTISPKDPKRVLVRCDMTGEYVTLDGGVSWRMFCLRAPARFFVWDPLDADVAYTSAAGLYRTADGCKTWSLVYPDPAKVTGVITVGDHAGPRIVTDSGAGDEIAALAVDPADSKTLYAVLSHGGKFNFMTSRDWGKTWATGRELPWGQAVRSLAAGGRKIYVDARSPKGSRTIYVIGDNQVSMRENGKWTVFAPPKGAGGFIDSSAGFPAKGGRLVVYAIFWSERSCAVAVSSDGGATWRADSSGMPWLRAIATCLNDPSTAYLSFSGLEMKSEAQRAFGIAQSTDTGRNWDLKITETSSKASPRVKDVWMDQTFGPDWGESPTGIGVAPSDRSILYTTDMGRTMRSTDGLDTLVGVYSKRADNGAVTTTGLDVTTCYGVHFDPFDAKHIFISYTDIGISQSRDGGTTWSSPKVPEKWRNTTYWVVFDPEVKGRAWAAMSSTHDLPRPKMFRGGAFRAGGGITITTDGGNTWVESNKGMAPTAATHIILDPKSPKDARVLYAAGFGTGVWKSVDGGKSWALKNNGIKGEDPFAWRLIDDGRGALYVLVARRVEDGTLGQGDGAIYKSTDRAETWVEVKMPQDANAPNGLAIDPKDPKRMYLATWGLMQATGDVGGGIYLTTDGAATWKNVESRCQHAYDITIDPRDPNVLYSCGFESSVLRSTDRGETWTRIKGFNFKWGHRVICDPVNPDKIFVSTFGGSVWYGPAAGDPNAKEDIVTPQVAYDKWWR